MKQHSFTLEVSGLDIQGDYDDRLYGAGCDDALVTVIDGRLLVEFDRLASSREDAIQSAIANIREAGGQVVRVIDLQPLDAATHRHV